MLPILAVLLTSCTGTRPSPPPMLAEPSGLSAAGCTVFFPKGRWQLTHAIDFHLGDGTTGNALGVLIVDGRSLSCALMTVEGLTLFEARSPGDGSLEVLRALPPFTGQPFAAGLIADVRTLFWPPEGSTRVGRLADGRTLCRSTDGPTVTDVVPGRADDFQLATYARTSGAGRAEPVRTRTVEGRGCTMVGGRLLAHDLTLTGHGPAAYTLNLHLLSAEPLPPSTP